jgi:isoleucyl-tRNA synthetase
MLSEPLAKRGGQLRKDFQMQSKFDSKYSFAGSEKQILDFWRDNECFAKLKEKNINGKK